MTIKEAIEILRDQQLWKRVVDTLDPRYMNKLSGAICVAIDTMEKPRPDWTPCAEGLPTTGEIVRALRNCADATGKRKPCTPECCFFNKTNCCAESLYSSAADRLESQEQKLELLNGGDFDVIDIPAALAYLESVEEILPHASALIDLIQSLKGTAIELTARAEQAELERDAAVADIEELLGQDDFIGICWACKSHDKCVGTRDAKITCVPKWRGLPQEGEGL